MMEHLTQLATNFWPILLFAAHISGILLALRALNIEHSPQGASAWIIALLLMPLLTIPLYLAFGTHRFRKHERGLLSHVVREQIKSRWQNELSPPTPCERAISRLCKLELCGGNTATPLIDGHQTYSSLADGLEAAQESICIEFYIIKNDPVGNWFKETLIAKAQEGLRIHLIYDELGSHKLPLGYLKQLRDAGIHITPFHGKRYWWSSILRLNYRCHRKLVIIDGKQAWLGGLNIGREYLGGKGTNRRWRDTFVSLTGPIVAQAQLCFMDDWHRATGEDLSPCLPYQGEAAGPIKALLLPSSNEEELNSWETAVLTLAGEARERLWIASPYFVPSEALASTLQTAALRGVDVRILIPAKGDNPLVNLATLTFIKEMEYSGVHMLAYTEGFLHQKVLLCDTTHSVIGSGNLDNRSLCLNYELSCLIRDEAFAQQLASILEQDMKQALTLSSSDWNKCSFIKQLDARLSRLLSPLL